MKRWFVIFFGAVSCLLVFAPRCPAPLVYVPGEGWHYESAGSTNRWQRARAKDQLEEAQAAMDRQDYRTAMKAARRTVAQWPLSDYAPQALYLVGRCHEEHKQDELAFKAYQRLIEKYPKVGNYDEVVKRQFAIANRYLAGQSFKLWGYVPFFPSMDKTIVMYEQIIKNGPYSEVAPVSQLNIGQAYENKMVTDYPSAAKAYERAADRYSDQKVGVDALFREGLAFSRQAKTAEYDQSVAAQAIATFSDFATLHPADARVPEAQRLIDTLRAEQARGSFDIAEYYEKNHRWQGALIYYNEVLSKDPNSRYAEAARRRIDTIKKRTER